MKSYQHFLITCFNLDFKIRPREQILDEKYLSKRLKLFTDICYPSVKTQTNQNFQWLVFFDSETPETVKKEIFKLASWEKMLPVFVDTVDVSRNIWGDIVRNYLQEDTEFVITTNLDNDDAISRDYIDLIQDSYREQEFEFINFPFGYILNDQGLFLREFLSSPFLSLIESKHGVVTCKIIGYERLYEMSQKGVSVRHRVAHPTWLQIVHDSNVLNYRDVNSVIQSPSKISQYFEIGQLSSNYVHESYKSQDYMLRFLRHIFKNKKLSLTRKIRMIATLINPNIPLLYFQYISGPKYGSYPKVTPQQARDLCRNS